jgi:hypothetical protein
VEFCWEINHTRLNIELTIVENSTNQYYAQNGRVRPKHIVEEYTEHKYKNNKFREELIAYFPWYNTSHIENDASNNSSVVACVFVIAVTFLPSRCLATIMGFLPSRCLVTIRWSLPSSCLATIGGIHRHRHTHTQKRDLMSLLYFFQNKESRLRRTWIEVSIITCF